jgi:hypothetical protein
VVEVERGIIVIDQESVREHMGLPELAAPVDAAVFAGRVASLLGIGDDPAASFPIDLDPAGQLYR